MKTNELMIGDWVNIYVFPNDEPKGDALFPARINAILGDSEDVECEFVLNGEGKVGYASRPAGTCLPIPLTTEILEKNGFERLRVSWVLKRNKYCVTIQFINGKWSLDTTNMLAGKDERGRNDLVSFCHDWVETIYVHELQHALRLCNIEKEITL